MVEISAPLVRQLRDKTDAPILECKKALIETSGDLKEAEELLKVKLGHKALKASLRTATEGKLAAQISADGRSCTLIEVNCETDFVVRNEQFGIYVNELLHCIETNNPTTVEELMSLHINKGKTVEEARIELIGKVGENVHVRRFIHTTSKEHIYQVYCHNFKIAAYVEFEGPQELGKDIAMHIVATRPACLDRTGIDPVILEREKNTFEQQAIQSGKPAAIARQMAEGRLSKFLSEVSLLEQPFVKSPQTTIAEHIKTHNGQVFSFKYLVLGEGLEKNITDFAQDVAAVTAKHL